MVPLLREQGSASTRRPASFSGLVPGPGPGAVGGGRPGGQRGQAPLPERPGLPGLVKARRPAEVGPPGVAPHLRLAEEGLAGADRAAGRRERVVQPGGRPVSGAQRWLPEGQPAESFSGQKRQVSELPRPPGVRLLRQHILRPHRGGAADAGSPGILWVK